jgi:hypothetical protein
VSNDEEYQRGFEEGYLARQAEIEKSLQDYLKGKEGEQLEGKEVAKLPGWYLPLMFVLFGIFMSMGILFWSNGLPWKLPVGLALTIGLAWVVTANPT